jgi:MoaA/NifB/PqqE/SkfB family radical SAM enzyme
MITVLISSGYRFLERFDEITPRADVLIFSLDHLGWRHDSMRGRPGLFDQVCAAIMRIRTDAPAIRVYINTAVSRLNVDAVPELARVARDLGAPIYFNPIETGMLGEAGSATVKGDLALDNPGLSDLAKTLIALKARRHPIANSYTYLRGFVGGKHHYRCHARKLCLELRPNGDLMDCLDRYRPVANLRQTSLPEVLSRPEIRRLRLKNVRCDFCNNANVIDTSHLWALHPESIYSLVRRNVSAG